MAPCFFATDLHGDEARYETLFARIRAERPRGVFLGGDLLPSGLFRLGGPAPVHRDFVGGFLAPAFLAIREELGAERPEVFLVLGNDDARVEEAAIVEAATRGAWRYAHFRRQPFEGFDVLGYNYVPPTPFLNKDWERYDVSRFVDPGCVSPEEGRRTVPVAEEEPRWATIQRDLEDLADGLDPSKTICLFHSPPYDTPLDRAALDGRRVDHAPVDVHVGSIAIRRFIEARGPRITLHGHVHESARLTGAWRCRIGSTEAMSAAHDGPELALVRFDPDRPEEATRELIGPASGAGGRGAPGAPR
ncbi:MAG TPA: metallophosphoesterase [Candidatus Eisenbacteria bacterium]|nr:metallophosphoesterase [Candidatus Eisenbacteria bacterium]